MRDCEDAQVIWSEKECVCKICPISHKKKKGEILYEIFHSSKLQRHKNTSLKITFQLCYHMSLYVRVKGAVQETYGYFTVTLK